MSFFHSNKFFHLFLLALIAFSLTACGGGSGDSPSDPVGAGNPAPTIHSLQRIVISPYLDTVVKGGQVHFTSTGIYDDQSSEDITAEVAWSVDDETLASVDTNGNVLPLNPGVVTVVASSGGLLAERTLTINDATLDSIQVIPQQVELANGMQQEFQAIGNYSDGSTQDLSQQVSWGSSDPQIVQMASAVAQSKLAGSVNVSASLNGISGQARLIVSSALLQGIEISVNTPSMAVGLSSPVSVQGFYSDDSTRDITDLVSWRVDDTSVVSVDASIEVVKALTTGSTTVHADVNGFQADTTVQVSDAILSKIEISPVVSSIAAGYKYQLQATGIYSNQTLQDLTQQVTWVSSNESVAVVDNRVQAKGEVTGLQKGDATITAFFEGQSGNSSVTVSDAELVNIQVSPGAKTLAMGLRQQYEATALYSDGSQKIVTNLVEWSSDSQLATLVDGDKPGLFQANSQGKVLLIATLNGKQGFTQLSISNATVNGLSLVAGSAKQALGTTQQLNAYAQYTDGSTVDVTAQATWSSSDTSVIKVSNADTTPGQASGLVAGNAQITAQFESVSSTLDLEVTTATLQQIVLHVASNGALYVNQQRLLEATGIYSDGSEQDLSQQLQWTSSNDSVAMISNGSDSPGVLVGLAAGTTLIQAGFAGIYSAELSLQVIDDPDYPASVSITSTPNVIYNDGIDATSLTAAIKPLQTQGVIADGTEVNFIITEDGMTRTQMATTVGGVASIDLTSTYKGFIVVTAELVDTDLNATTAIYSTDSFVNVFQIIRSARVALIENNTVYLAGSQFALYIRNLSNRDFGLDKFFVRNGGVDFPDTPVTDSAFLSDGTLDGGEYAGAGYLLDDNTVDNTISLGFQLSDSTTSTSFGFTIGFNLVP